MSRGTTNHFNYTGRARVPHRAIDLVVHEGPPRTFDATWNLTNIPLAADAKVYLEATSAGSPTVRRFACGTVAEPAFKTAVPLGDLGGDAPVFAFKVVDESEELGRLLAWAEQLHPERPDLPDHDAGRAALLPVNYVPLGERPYKVSFDNPGGAPWLLVNENIPTAREYIRADAQFAALVFPEVVRRVLERVVADKHYEVNNDDADWRDLWLRLALLRNGGDPVPPVADEAAPTGEELQELDDWVEASTDAFAVRAGWREKLVAAVNGEEAP